MGNTREYCGDLSLGNVREECLILKRSCIEIMNVNGGVPFNLLILEGSNWERWSAMMKSIFEAQEVLKVVHNGYGELMENSTNVQILALRD